MQSGLQSVQGFGDLIASALGKLLPLGQERLQQRAQFPVPFGQFLVAVLFLPDGLGGLQIMCRREGGLLGKMRADRPGQSGQACQDIAPLFRQTVLGLLCLRAAPVRRAGVRRQRGTLGGQGGLCLRQLGSAGGDCLLLLRDPVTGLAEQRDQRLLPVVRRCGGVGEDEEGGRGGVLHLLHGWVSG